MTSRTPLPQSVTATTIGVIGEDLLQNIVTRLPATSFASAACVSRSWNVVCDRVLSRPKLSSACSFNHSLQDAVKEVVDKVLSEPVRPHFVIASVNGSFDLQGAHRLITAALGTRVPIVINRPGGIIGRDAVSNELKEIEWYFERETGAILLIVGFLPGMKVTTIPLLKPNREPMIDEFITNIREFSTSVSGCNSPAAIIMFGNFSTCMRAGVVEKLDYAMSPDTIIVGDTSTKSRCTNGIQIGISAVALVFAVDMNKPHGIGETQFHAVSSSGLSPVGPTYKLTYVNERGDFSTKISARKKGSSENIDGGTILKQVDDELGERTQYKLYIGVTKKRNYSIGQEKVGCMRSLSIHVVCGLSASGFWLYQLKSFNLDNQKYIFVTGGGLKTGDRFRFYYLDAASAQSSVAAVSSHLSSFNQASNNATRSDKPEVFGGLLFTSSDPPDINISSPFLDNFPGVTLSGNFCSSVIGRRVITPYGSGSQKQKKVECSVHDDCGVFLIMSCTPSIA